MIENNDNEQKYKYAVRQQNRFECRAEYSFDEDNQRIYRDKANVWEDKAGKVEGKLAKCEKADIIKLENVHTMTISSIKRPIEQRNTGKGNSNAVLLFGVEFEQ